MAQSRFFGRRRALATNSTQAAFALAAGTITDLSTYGYVTMDDARGICFSIVGVGAANKTIPFKVWGVLTTPDQHPSSPANVTDGEIFLICTQVATLGAKTGAGTTTLVPSTEKYADTIAKSDGTTAGTELGAGYALMETGNGLGTAWVHSPADDTIAYYGIPNVPADGLIFEFGLSGGTAATSANAVYELIRRG